MWLAHYTPSLLDIFAGNRPALRARPGKAKPDRPRWIFLPSSITSEGMSRYSVCITNVRRNCEPGSLGIHPAVAVAKPLRRLPIRCRNRAERRFAEVTRRILHPLIVAI